MDHFFISVGATGALFTLRQTYQHTFYIGGRPYTETRSFHIQNLSQDPEEAFKKAEKISLEFGTPLLTKKEELAEEMRKISRASKEESERRKEAEDEFNRIQIQHRMELLQQRKDMINQGIMPIGQYIDVPFKNIKPDYLTWVASKVESFEEDSLMQLVAKKIISDYPDLLFKEPKKEFFGSEKVRYEFDVMVTRTTGFWRDSFSGYGQEWCDVVTMITEDGYCLVSMGSFKAEVGSKLRIKATVKSHNIYNEQYQTMVNRVKVI